MADNVIINASSGTANIASDDVGGVQYQYIKLDMGGDGVASHVTAANPLPVTIPLIVNTTINDGIKVVTTAGTRAALATSATIKQIIITALSTNTGTIVVGGSTCVAAPGTQGSPTRRGTPLGIGDTVTIDITNPSLIYIDATTSGDGVSWTALS